MQKPVTFPGEPFFLQWHITDACNLRCKHCYCIDYTQKSVDNDKLKHVINEYEKLLKYLGKKGRIQFAGGEPLVSPVIYDLIKDARERNMAVRILSNGTIISDKIAAKIRDSGCYIVQVSIEGSKKVNDSIRDKDSFKLALEGIKTLRSNGIEVTVAMTLSRTNVSEIPYVFKLAAKYANRLGFHRLVPIGTGVGMIDEMLTPAELLKAYKQIYKLKQKYPDLLVPLRDPVWRGFFERNPDALSGCSAGYNGLCVGTGGDVYPCRRLPVKIGNVFETPLTELWNTEIMQDLRNRQKRKGICGVCEFSKSCGGCPGIAYAVTGDYMEQDPQCFKSIRQKDFETKQEKNSGKVIIK